MRTGVRYGGLSVALVRTGGWVWWSGCGICEDR